MGEGKKKKVKREKLEARVVVHKYPDNFLSGPHECTRIQSVEIKNELTTTRRVRLFVNF